MSRSVHPNERTNVQLPVRPSSQSRRFSTPRQLRPAASIPGSLIRPPLLLLLLAVLVLVVVPEIAWMLIDGRAARLSTELHDDWQVYGNLSIRSLASHRPGCRKRRTVPLGQLSPPPGNHQIPPYLILILT